MKYLIKSYLILLIIFFEAMLCFAFAFNSKAMFIAIMVIFNTFLFIAHICIDLKINAKEDIDN